MCNLSWTPHSNLEKDNSLKTTPVLAQRWAVWNILTKNWVPIMFRVGYVMNTECGIWVSFLVATIVFTCGYVFLSLGVLEQ